MNYFQSIILGALQGVAEFLPVSSSGHLVVMRSFMRLDDVPVLFDVLLHVSTLVVVVIVFRERVFRILRALVLGIAGKKDREIKENVRLFLIIVVATVFTVVIGFGISYLSMETKPRIVSLLFIVTGIILLLTRKTGQDTGYNGLKFRHGIITGIAQGLGVFPGISRSGITISSALFSGIKKEKVGEFSFLISIPAILGALVLEFRDAGDLFSLVDPGVVFTGIAASFVVGLFSLLLLLRVIERGKLYYFSFYLIPFGVLSFILL